MNGAGFFLAVAGVWVLSQVLAGDALGRLGIFGGTKNKKPDANTLFGYGLDLADPLHALLGISDPTPKHPTVTAVA